MILQELYINDLFMKIENRLKYSIQYIENNNIIITRIQ